MGRYVDANYWITGYAVGDDAAFDGVPEPARTLSIGAEDRVLSLGAEDRVLAVKPG